MGKKKKVEEEQDSFIKNPKDLKVFLKVVKVEGYKSSLAWLKHEFLKRQEDGKNLRQTLKELQDKVYPEIDRIVAETLSLQQSCIQLSQNEKTMNEAYDPSLLDQQKEICKLQETVDKLETQLQQIHDTMEACSEFQNGYSQTDLDAKVTALNTKMLEARVKYVAELEGLQERHEWSMQNTAYRAEKIMNGVEGVACQNLLDVFPKKSLAIERMNRRLHEEIKVLLRDVNRLENNIQSLEDRNLELMCDTMQVDYNFTYLNEDEEDPFIRQDYVPQFELFGPKHTFMFDDVAKAIQDILYLEKQEKMEKVMIKGGQVPRNPTLIEGPTRYYSLSFETK